MSTTMTTTNHGSKNGNREPSDQKGRHESNQDATFIPRFDVWEGDDELVLYGDLPGVDSDHLSIEFENRQLTIHGTVNRWHEDDGSLYSEYQIGDFHRTFTIGESINADNIRADLKDGVLTLRLPKVEEAKPRKIEVKVN